MNDVRRGVLCFGCGGFCLGHDGHQRIVTPPNTREDVRYVLSTPVMFQPYAFVLYGELDTHVDEIAFGHDQQLMRAGVPIAAFSSSYHPGEIVEFIKHGDNAGLLEALCPTVQAYTVITVRVSRPVDDILVVGRYLAG